MTFEEALKTSEGLNSSPQRKSQTSINTYMGDLIAYLRTTFTSVDTTGNLKGYYLGICKGKIDFIRTALTFHSEEIDSETELAYQIGLNAFEAQILLEIKRTYSLAPMQQYRKRG